MWEHSSFSRSAVKKNAKRRPSLETWGQRQDHLNAEQLMQTARVLSCLPNHHRSLTAVRGFASAPHTVYLVASTEVGPGRSTQRKSRFDCK